MISFEPTEEQELVRSTARDLAAESLRPLARDADEESAIPADFLRSTWQLGLVSSQIPEAFGGAGAPRSPTTGALLLEELAVGDAALALAALAPALFANTLVDHGTPKQQERYLRWAYYDHRLVLTFQDVTGFGRFRLTPDTRSEFERVKGRVQRRP